MSDIRLKIVGLGVTPESISLGDLAYILTAFNNAVVESANNSSKFDTPIKISLGAIKAGSAVYEIECNSTGRREANRIVRAIRQKDGSLLPAKSRKSVEALHGRLRKNDWSASISRRSSTGRRVSATLSPNEPLFEKPRLYGHTSIVAQVIKAGGEARRRSAELLLNDGRRLTSRVSSIQLTAELGHLLYQRVELVGRAIWSSDTGSLNEFKIEALGSFRQNGSDPQAALRELHDLDVDFWQEHDVSTFLRSLRSESDEASA